MSTLIIIDAFHAGAEKTAAKLISGAAKLNVPVDSLVLGGFAQEVADQIASLGLGNIYTFAHADFTFPSAEQVTALVQHHFNNYKNYITAANATGKDFMPRLAMRLGVQAVTDIVDISGPTSFKRPIYAGNVIVSLQCQQTVKCLTLRPTAFAAAAAHGSVAEIKVLEAELPIAKVRYKSTQPSADSQVDITSAAIVIAAGNGIGTKEKFEEVQALAVKMGAGVGASRALVDAGVVANEYQVGQTGKVIAPAIYIALGISGAVQHTAGIKDSGTIFAVNKDAEAPIAAVSDYLLVADLNEVMPALLAAF